MEMDSLNPSLKEIKPFYNFGFHIRCDFESLFLKSSYLLFFFFYICEIKLLELGELQSGVSERSNRLSNFHCQTFSF